MGRLLRLTLPRFFVASGEDSYEFLVACEDWIHSLGLVETHWVDYTIYQLDLEARHWRRDYLDSRSSRFSLLIWT